MKMFMSKTGRDGPEQIEQTHHQNQHRDDDQFPGVAFKRPRQQKQKRKRKVENHYDKCNRAPAAMRSRQVLMNLLRQISRPDNQELRKREIGPQHDQRQQQFAQIVKVQLRDVECIGSCFDSIAITAMTNARALRAQAATKINP